MKFAHSLLVGGACALLPFAAAGAQTVYYGQNDAGTVNSAISNASSNFFSALAGNVGTETFESLALGTSSPITLTFPGAGDATLVGNSQVVSGNNSGAVPYSGSQYLLTITGSSGSEFRINFVNPVAAFGFYGSDIGDAGSNLILRYTRQDGSTYDSQVPYDYNTQPLANGNLLFYGFIDTANPFTSIQFLSTASGDYFGFDNMTIASKGQVVNPPGMVPEPSTVALVGAGVLALGAAARRRARAG